MIRNYRQRKRDEAQEAGITLNEGAIADLAELASDNEVTIEELAQAFVEYVEYNESKE